MKIDQHELNVIMKYFLHQYGIEHFTSVISYTDDDELGNIMILPQGGKIESGDSK